jgi:rfaE bifunctional protein nucleotidyltransferase chain/domain
MPREFRHKTKLAQNDRTSFERGIFGFSSNPEARFIADHDELAARVAAIRTLGLSIVLTSGTFDLVHIGHARYLEKAKEYGEVLIVGVDSDDKVRKRKGNDRPVVPEAERVQMLAHLRAVDIITLKHLDEPQWSLIKMIKPDTLIVTEETYDDDTLHELSKLCGRVVCLEPQAETSTSAQIRKLQIGWQNDVVRPIEKVISADKMSEQTREKIRGIINKLR